ncbi:MAG TPA: hypothetical protein VF791_20710 [Pyrinomonadaceae bacterium]
MKRSLLILCLIALVSLIGWTSYGQKQKSSRTSWEYLVGLEGGGANNQINLRALGAEGWELTAITTEDEIINGDQHIPLKTYYFKRPK